MNKSQIFASLAFVVVLWLIWNSHREMAKMSGEVEGLKRKQEGGPVGGSNPIPSSVVWVKGTPEEQAKCAKQSQAYFDQWLRDAAPEYKSTHVTRTFSDHYDPGSRSCYVEIVITPVRIGKEFSTTKFVSDAYEGGDLASYGWISQTGKKYWEVKPMDCRVKGRDGKDVYCDSDDSFKELVFNNYGVKE